MTPTVLITGGLGYVGGRVAEALRRSGKYRLRLATRSVGNPPPAWLPDAEIVTLDVTSTSGLDNACRDVSSIVHLAALSENDCLADPKRALLINGLGTLNLLQAAQRAGVERFLYFSTAHVYRAPLTGRIDESTVPRPVHPYAITHHIAEDFVLAAHATHAITGIVLRMSNGFGAPKHAGVNRWTLIVNDLCRQAVTTGRIVMRSAGQDQRNFISLEDVGRASLHMLDLPVALVGDGLFNLGGTSSMRVIDLVGLILERCQVVLGYRPALEHPVATGTEPPSLDYRSDRLFATGFAPNTNMIGEIDATLRLCQSAFGVER